MEIFIVIIVILIFLVIPYVYKRGKQQGGQELADIARRVENMKQMAETRRFFTPDDPDPNPNFEYCNASQQPETNTYDLILFDHRGLQSARPDLAESEFQRFIREGGWQVVAQEYSGKAGQPVTLKLQYSRPKNK